MAEYGLKIYNNKDELVIDSNFINYSLWDYGTLTAVNNMIPATYAQITGPPPIIAIHPRTWFEGGMLLQGGPGGIINGGPPWDHWWTEAMTYYRPGGIDVDWVAAQTTDIINPNYPNDSYGLKVYNGDGNVVFTSQGRQLRVIDSVTFNTPAVGTSIVINHAYTPKPYYIIQNLYGWCRNSNGSYLISLLQNGTSSVNLAFRYVSAGDTTRNRYKSSYQLIVCALGD